MFSWHLRPAFHMRFRTVEKRFKIVLRDKLIRNFDRYIRALIKRLKAKYQKL